MSLLAKQIDREIVNIPTEILSCSSAHLATYIKSYMKIRSYSRIFIYNKIWVVNQVIENDSNAYAMQLSRMNEAGHLDRKIFITNKNELIIVMHPHKEFEN